MTLFSYEIFDAVARQGSFNKAAQQLHLTPSAISHAIAVMEAELGFPQLLFLLPVILLSKFEGTHIVSLQVRDVVLMLKQQVLHFLFIDLKKSFNVIT